MKEPSTTAEQAPGGSQQRGARHRPGICSEICWLELTRKYHLKHKAKAKKKKKSAARLHLQRYFIDCVRPWRQFRQSLERRVLGLFHWMSSLPGCLGKSSCFRVCSAASCWNCGFEMWVWVSETSSQERGNLAENTVLVSTLHLWLREAALGVAALAHSGSAAAALEVLRGLEADPNVPVQHLAAASWLPSSLVLPRVLGKGIRVRTWYKSQGDT